MTGALQAVANFSLDDVTLNPLAIYLGPVQRQLGDLL